MLLKNVDNVRAGRRRTSWWRTGRSLLAGTLLATEARAREHLHRLRAGNGEEPLAAASRFLADELGITVRRRLAAGSAAAERRAAAGDRLDRPLRVCGVVRNQGEPGGGPFWVEREGGEVSLQIVELAELGDDPGERERFAAATHFNPVDLAFGLRDADDRAFDLDRHVDPGAVFIARKSHDGRPLLALERPGLWNGAMAGWNTIFVEVPDATFAPVKTLFDLLRPEHQ